MFLCLFIILLKTFHDMRSTTTPAQLRFDSNVNDGVINHKSIRTALYGVFNEFWGGGFISIKIGIVSYSWWLGNGTEKKIIQRLSFIPSLVRLECIEMKATLSKFYAQFYSSLRLCAICILIASSYIFRFRFYGP